MKVQKVKAADVVNVTATGLAQYMKAGRNYKLHRIAAENLIERGLVRMAS